MLGTITRGEYKNDPLPNNVYLAKLLKVEEKLVEFVKPDTKEAIKYTKLNWTFEILTEPFKKRRAFGKTPSNWIANKKLDNWLIAVGVNVALGTSVKIEDLKDLYAKIVTKNKPYKDSKTGEDKNFPEVTDILPLDSLDQIKVRELVAGVPAASVSTQPVATAPVTVTATHTFTPPVSSLPVQPGIPRQTFIPVQPTFTPAPNVTQPTGTPSRTIPF
jgi:hypothetical protein